MNIKEELELRHFWYSWMCSVERGAGMGSTAKKIWIFVWVLYNESLRIKENCACTIS